METILVVDDEASVLYSFQRLFGSKYRVLTALSGEEGLRLYELNRPSVVFLDQRMPGLSGLETLRALKEMDPQAVAVIMTAYGDTETVICSMQEGAFDYITKPLDGDQLEALIQKGILVRRSREDIHLFDASPVYPGPQLIGQSPPMQEVYKLIGQVAGTDSTVLIRGESGTGKELVARAIHVHSVRKNDPFVVVNCAAIPETLLESELFGYEKGAFSGADRRKEGKFELAHGGTLFLDEIGDMTPSTQTKILRALQERHIERLGGKEVIGVDVRILAATHQDLEMAMESGRFREDLYWRLNVVTISLPPLRERKEDIPALVEHFALRFREECACRVTGISRDVLRTLQAYDWPGNVRELENWVRRALILCRGETITMEDLPPLATFAKEGQGPPPEDFSRRLQRLLAQAFEDPKRMKGPSYHRIVEQVETELVRNALKISGGNQLRAARMLGITRTTLRKKMERCGLL
jgi:DNA-binding NtrC family response regulator